MRTTLNRKELTDKAYTQWDVQVICRKCGHRRSVNSRYYPHRTGIVTLQIWNMESECVMCEYERNKKANEKVI